MCSCLCVLEENKIHQFTIVFLLEFVFYITKCNNKNFPTTSLNTHYSIIQHIFSQRKQNKPKPVSLNECVYVYVCKI